MGYDLHSEDCQNLFPPCSEQSDYVVSPGHEINRHLARSCQLGQGMTPATWLSHVYVCIYVYITNTITRIISICTHIIYIGAFGA